MQFDDIQQHATIDLARFIAPNHFHFRGHTPAAYKEIAEPLLQQRLGLTIRDLCAAKALARWASFEEIERAAFASLVSNVGEPPKTIPEHELMRIDALRHNVCLAAHDYARQVGDPLLIEAWPKPVWMAETQPQAAPEFAPVVEAPAPGSNQDISIKPWRVYQNGDPEPAQPWYTPARYFARQLVLEQPTLLSKRSILADKASTALFNAGYKKRGGKLKFASGTVLKAFANLVLG